MGVIILLSISKRPRLQGFGYTWCNNFIIIVVILGILLGVGITSVIPKPYPILDLIDILLGIILLLVGI